MGYAVIIAIVVVGLSGCTSAVPPAYSACSTQPGTYACQIEQYERVSD